VRLLHHHAHEDEQRHCGERLLHHRGVELEGQQVEHQRPEAPVPEDNPEKEQRERDREADENGEQHRPDHEKANDFGAHSCGHFPFFAA
jgi:hypothetical protein